MINLKTTYLGLELKNPIIVGASNLVSDSSNLKSIEEAGASAIVFKSLFEEQIQLESYQLGNQIEEYNDRNAEMIKLFPDFSHAGPQDHLNKLRKAKQTVKIPIIASLNAVYHESWVEYAKLIEDTGVDALELNFYSIPKDSSKDEKIIIDEQLAIVKEIKKTLHIPVSVKLSPYYTNVLRFVAELDKAGVDGIVMFNRMFQPDIDLEKEEHFSPFNLSCENENRLVLRFTGLVYGRTKASICGNSGIMDGSDVLKAIMVGADAVQIVSTLYRHKISHISAMLDEINNWMKSKNYNTLKDFKGKLSEKNTKDPFVYKRAQYIDLLLRSEELLKPSTLR